MNLNHILFLVALLNLLGDLYNIMSFRRHLPRWIAVANVACIIGCLTARVVIPDDSGMFSIGIFIIYVVVIKTCFRPQTKRPSLASRYTKLLIGLNVASYLYQSSQPPLSPRGLVELGAFFGPFFEAGEWWRIFTAQFLHWGVAHLAFNMLGLWVLGPRVESRLGGFRFITTYLLCGAGGMAIAWGAGKLSDPTSAPVMLGASASVLALVGISAALALKDYRTTKSISAKAQLSSMIQVVVLQAVFDTMVPEVSSTAHLGGAVCGFLVGLVVGGKATSHPENARPAPASPLQPWRGNDECPR